MAFSPATQWSQSTHRAAFLAALLLTCLGVARTEDHEPLRIDWTDSDRSAVSLRIEDGSLNLYGDGNLAMPDIKFFQFFGKTMTFSTNEDFKNSVQSTAPSFVVVQAVQRLTGLSGQMGNQVAPPEHWQPTEASSTTGEAAPSVEWTDTEGDVVSLRGTGGSVGLWANGEELMPKVAGVKMHNDGVTLDFISGEMTALTVVRDASDAKRIQDFLNTNDGVRRAPAPKHAQQRGDALRDFEELVRKQQERSRVRPEIAGISVKDQGLAEPKAVVTQHHVLHLGRRTFAETVLPTTGYPVENWVVMFCYSWHEPCQNIVDPYSAWSREWEAKLNQDLLTTHVRFATVDCATDKELCNDQEVEGYPNVKHYSEGVVVGKWTGGRENDKTRLAKWLAKRLGGLGASEKPEDGEQPDAAQSDLSAVAREQGVNALLVLGVSALVFRAVCLDAELWKGPAEAPPAAARGGPGVLAGPRGLPAEWARRGSLEL